MSEGTREIAGNSANARLEKSLIYEVFVTAVTLLALVMAVLLYLPGTADLVRQVLAAVDTVVIVPVLLFDFARTLILSRRKIHYLLTWGWLDFLGSFPYLPLLRLLRLGRMLVAWQRLRHATPAEAIIEVRRQLGQSTFLIAFFVGVLVLVGGSIAIVTVEANSPFANIRTGEDAVWWAFVTVATVGYGDFYPVTVTGRNIAIGIMFVGIGIFSIFTGYLSTSFQVRRRREEENALAALRAEVAELRTLLEQLTHERT
jgi:voltage-gated potassium channel